MYNQPDISDHSHEGVLGEDFVYLVTTSATGTFVDKKVGVAKMVNISGLGLEGVDADNYILTQPSTTANITAAVLTVSGVTANNKVYDGTTNATLNTGSASLSGVYGTDDVNLNITGAIGSFIDANVGNSKLVTTSGFTLGGTDSDNYTLSQPTTSGSIPGIVLSVTGITAQNRVYNGTTAATLNLTSATLVGVRVNDVVLIVTTGVTGTFVNKNIGTSKTVTISGITLGGTHAGNYIITQPTTTADITPKNLTITGVIPNNKVYDGTTFTTLNTGGAVLNGKVIPDVVNPVFSGAIGTFADKNAGTAKPVTISGITMSGTDAYNYILTQPVASAVISSKALTVTANSLSKSYRTTYVFTGSEFTLVGLVPGDPGPSFTISCTGAIASANVGTYPILISGGIDNNYIFTYLSGIMTVNKAVLSITADDKTKAYGHENPAFSITCSGFINNEDVSVIDLFPVPSTIANNSSIPGIYPITLTGGNDNNYDLQLKNGTLTQLEKLH